MRNNHIERQELPPVEGISSQNLHKSWPQQHHDRCCQNQKIFRLKYLDKNNSSIAGLNFSGLVSQYKRRQHNIALHCIGCNKLRTMDGSIIADDNRMIITNRIRTSLEAV